MLYVLFCNLPFYFNFVFLAGLFVALSGGLAHFYNGFILFHDMDEV